ncbi:MAG: EAL domain-containing protein [Pseudomonadota bacterium]
MRNIAAYLVDTRRKPGTFRDHFFSVLVWPIGALILAIAGWSLLLAHLAFEQRNAETAALKHAGDLARNYADHITRTTEAIDQITLYVSYAWEASGGKMRLEKIREIGVFPPSSILNVTIFDRNGLSLTSTVANRKNISIADQPFFQTFKKIQQTTLDVGALTQSRVSNRIVIPFSRKLTDRTGNFDGAIVVAVVPAYFTESYDESTLGKNGFLGVAGPDGLLKVTRTGQKVYPPGTSILTSIPKFTFKSGSMLMDGEQWFVDRKSRYVGWSESSVYPLVAMAGVDLQTTLLPSRVARETTINYAIGATLALFVFTCIAMMLSLHLAWRKHELESAQATYRVATEGGNEGFYIVRPLYGGHGEIDDFEVIDSNHRGAELLRQRREELIGIKISHLYASANPARLIEMLHHALEHGSYEADSEVPAESPLTPRWVHVKIVRANSDLAVTLRDVTEAKAHVDELERRSNADTLTGLPNRNWVHAYLPEAVRHAGQNGLMLAVLFIDLDGFKAVNDSAGHAAGDELLRIAGVRLTDATRPHDHVVRLGGDEFLVILEQILHKAEAAHVAERIRHAFRENFRLFQSVHSVGASIGISVYPSDGADADTLLRNADVAMYSVKAGGKGGYHFYDQRFYDALRVRMEKEAELNQAVEHDQFIMYYQPRVDLLSGRISSMEALVRWIHPVKGLLEPREFIALAEETGLILALGELVIDKVCAQLALWSRQDQEMVPVSINVSPRQFNEVDVSKILSAAFLKHDFDHRLVEIELTESSMMGDTQTVINTLAAIRKMGIKLLVDDFGTGYSSLSQLQRLDFDVLKVDRAFTAEIDSTQRGTVFFKAIITMAHALDMRVVAEGVENIEQIKILKMLECDEVQGFYISRPMPPLDRQPLLPRWFFPSTT